MIIEQTPISNSLLFTNKPHGEFENNFLLDAPHKEGNLYQQTCSFSQEKIDKKESLTTEIVIQKQKPLFKRIFSVIRPILLLNKTFKTTYSLIKKTFRVIKKGRHCVHSWNNEGFHNNTPYALFKTVIAITILVGTILSHPISSVLSISHNLKAHIVHLLQAVDNHNLKLLAYAVGQIFFDVINITILFVGGVQLNLVFGAIKVLINVCKSAQKFAHQKKLKGASYLIATAIKTAQLILI